MLGNVQGSYDADNQQTIFSLANHVMLEAIVGAQIPRGVRDH